MNCLKCEKPLQFVPDTASNPDGAGEMVVAFHYGSRNDQCLGFAGRERLILGTAADPPHHQRLLCCDQIRAYICDDCFQTHSRLFEGWSVNITKREERKVL